MTRKAQKIDVVQPVEDGMKIDAPMQLPVATTYMFAPNALTQTTLPTIVTPQPRNSC
jgi:hypothetical protein